MAATEVDLNLLRILEALLDEESVTGAARRLGVTQSAVSHALARLREQLGDALLVRTSTGMAPTPRARELREPIRRGLGALREALETRFDPATATRTFNVAMTDQLGATILPAIWQRLAADAPKIDLRITPVVRNVERTLETAAADLVISGAFATPEAPGLYRQRLFGEDLTCVVRAGHPTAKAELTLEQFCALSHVLVAPRGGRGVVDDALAQHGAARRVAVVVPHFLVAPFVVAHSDLVLTVAASVAKKLSPMLGLKTLTPPIELPRATYWQIWHERTHEDAAHKWLRAAIAEVCESHEHERQPAAATASRQRRKRS
jgi:DNA-binding transcriptional LysR family regulator